MNKIYFSVLALALALLIFGSVFSVIHQFSQRNETIQDQPTPTPSYNYDDASKQQCIKTGGIVIESSWDGRITNCIYKPKNG